LQCNRVDVIHQVFRLVEDNLTLLNYTAVKVCLSLDLDRVLIEQLLLSVWALARSSVISFHVGGV
jgi:hypothetical protein